MNSDAPVSGSQSSSFLYGFVEESVEIPVDGLNGECIVHYGGEYSMYTMRVKMVNGVREGEAMIRNDDVLFMELTYANGSLTGQVRRYATDGRIEMRGQLRNGVERGLFKEYDANGKVVWRKG